MHVADSSPALHPYSQTDLRHTCRLPNTTTDNSQQWKPLVEHWDTRLISIINRVYPIRTRVIYLAPITSLHIRGSNYRLCLVSRSCVRWHVRTIIAPMSKAEFPRCHRHRSLGNCACNSPQIWSDKGLARFNLMKDLIQRTCNHVLLEISSEVSWVLSLLSNCC